MGTVNVGDRLGKFEIARRLGSGGAGVVFAATNVETGGHFALKALHANASTDEEIYGRFVREIAIAQKLDHPNIVSYDDCGIEADVLFYTMELVPWGSLAEVLGHRQALPWREACECGVEICRGLGYLHAADVVHRDLKPANIFLSDDGRLKLGDFGLARDLNEFRLTMDGQTVGTAKYLAPEQARGEEKLDGRTDLYALGCILFELLAGRPPFISDDPSGGYGYVELMTKHCEDAPPQVTDFAACPPELAAMIDQLLAKDPGDRPESAEAVAIRLEQILVGEHAGAKLPTQHDSLADTPPTSSDEGVQETESLTARLHAPQPTQREVSWKMLAIVAAVVVIGIAAITMLNSGS